MAVLLESGSPGDTAATACNVKGGDLDDEKERIVISCRQLNNLLRLLHPGS